MAKYTYFKTKNLFEISFESYKRAVEVREKKKNQESRIARIADNLINDNKLIYET